jgi:hypothetical protein
MAINPWDIPGVFPGQDELGNMQAWISTPEGNRPITQAEISAYEAQQQQGQALQAQLFDSNPAFTRLTPQQAQQYLSPGNALEKNAFLETLFGRTSQPDNMIRGLWNDGGNNLWLGDWQERVKPGTGSDDLGSGWDRGLTNLTQALVAAGVIVGGGAAAAEIGAPAAAGGTEAGAGAGAAEGGGAVVGGSEAAGEGSLGGDVLYGGGSSETLSGGTEGDGMWDWLDDIDTGGGVDPGAEGTFNAPLEADTSTGAFDQFGMDNPNTGFQDQGFDPGGSGDSGILSQLKSAYQAGTLGKSAYEMLTKALGAGGSASAGSSALAKKSTGGGILDNILSDPLGSAFNATPFLLALSEANRQGGDLNNVIGKINSDAYRKSVLDPYDLETGQGRAMMQQDQGLRGVAGSSFGDQSLNNYDYMRNLGRGDIASKANLASAGLEGQLINTRNTNRNLLLGAGLNASGKLFSPQKDPFDLNKLFGIT